jgi:small subunit ribosomal protein S16
MVKIRLARAGAKKRPFYHVVATDSRSKRDGRFIERLGFYNPGATGGETKLSVDVTRLEHWTKTGAQVSERVTYLVKNLPNAATKPAETKPAETKAAGEAQAAA